MKNKKAKIDKKITIGILAIIGIVFLFVFVGQTKISIEEMEQPTDISEGGDQNQGLKLLLRNTDGELVEIPEWFSAGYEVPFTIVTRTAPITCTVATVAVDCIGYTPTNEIDCWSGNCVLKNIAQMAIQATVENPPTSEVTFQNVYVSGVTGPAGFVFPADSQVLNPGDPAYFFTSNWVDISAVTGQQAFQVEVTGTNQYTGALIMVPSATLTLVFEADPTGSFDVNIVSPI